MVVGKLGEAGWRNAGVDMVSFGGEVGEVLAERLLGLRDFLAKGLLGLKYLGEGSLEFRGIVRSHNNESTNVRDVALTFFFDGEIKFPLISNMRQ